MIWHSCSSRISPYGEISGRVMMCVLSGLQSFNKNDAHFRAKHVKFRFLIFKISNVILGMIVANSGYFFVRYRSQFWISVSSSLSQLSSLGQPSFLVNFEHYQPRKNRNSPVSSLSHLTRGPLIGILLYILRGVIYAVRKGQKFFFNIF